MSKYSKHVTDVSIVRKFVERSLSLVHEHSKQTQNATSMTEFSCILVPTTTEQFRAAIV